MGRTWILRVTVLFCVLEASALQSDEYSGGKSNNLRQFGRAMRDEFLFQPGYTSLNHGSYGTYPKAVQKALREYQDRSESNPDLWMRKQLAGELAKVRRLLADLINCNEEDLVMIPNTTTGMNAIFRSMVFQHGDKILHFNTAYYAMRRLIEFVKDYSNGSVTSVEFLVEYPITNDQLVIHFEEFVRANLPIRIALVDHISSVPSVVNPIERLVSVLRKYNVSVLIDGAHAIGQVPIDIRALDPDYYITNCHKWLYAPRGTAMLYVREPLHGSIHPAIISSGYTQPASFQEEFYWTGTMDYSSYLAVPAALEFRQQLGGEDAIRAYTHNLALQGGRLLSVKFGGTRILQSEDQIGNMVDVELPLLNHDNAVLTAAFWVDILMAHNVYAPPVKHAGRWWVRCSAQIYNDLEDFNMLGDVAASTCNELNNNETTKSTGNSLHKRFTIEL